MIVFESRKQRRVLVRLERGEDPVRSLVQLAEAEKIRAAWVRGVGALEWAELDRHDPERGAPAPSTRVDEACEALSVEGHLALEDGAPAVTLHATLAVPGRGNVGGRVVGGRIVAAAAYSLELVVDVFEDVRLERVEDADTGLSVWAGTSTRGATAVEAPTRGPTEAPTRAWTTARDEDDEDDDEDRSDAARGEAPSSGGGVSWADVAAVSAAPEVAPPPRSSMSRSPSSRSPSGSLPARPAHAPPPIPGRTREPEPARGPQPTKGDFVQHRQFGTCRVDRDDGAGGITLRLPSGVRKKIKLQYMEVGSPRNEDGKTVYPIRPRRR